MADVNKAMILGRLTRDVEVRSFANGGKVAKFGIAVASGRKKNQQTGKWEKITCFLDVEAFNRGENGKLADLCEQYLRKGKPCFIEGKLAMQEWSGQDGQRRSKIVVEADDVQFLDFGDRSDGDGEPRSQSGGSQRQQSKPTTSEMFNELFGENPFAKDE